LLLTNRAGFRTLAFPVAEPVVFTVSGALNRGETNVFQVDVPTNMPGWRLVLTASGTADPDIYLRVGAIPTAAQYTQRSINRPVDTIFLSDTEATNQTYFITVVLPASDLGVASYTLSTELSAVIPLAWDPGTNAAGTLVYTNQSLLGGDHFFRMTAQDAALGVWRTRLHVLSNEADLFLRRGNLPTVTTYDYSSTRLGDDGVALVQGGQFASNDVWYVLVYAPPGAQWLLYSGNAYVATLPTPGLDESGGTNLVVEPEGMNFYRTVMGTNIIAWRLGLNGLTNAVLVRTNKLAHPYSAAYYNWNQPGQMLLVPSYHYSDILSDFHFSSSFIRRFRWDW
jgi:hypothetical protein